MKKLSKALSWDDLANEYDSRCGGRKARTLPMNTIWNWAASKKELFRIDKKKGTIHKILN
jgi:hypothetical protein